MQFCLFCTLRLHFTCIKPIVYTKLSLGKIGKTGFFKQTGQKFSLFKMCVFVRILKAFSPFNRKYFSSRKSASSALKFLGVTSVPVQVRPAAPSRTTSNHIILVTDKWLRCSLSFTTKQSNTGGVA